MCHPEPSTPYSHYSHWDHVLHAKGEGSALRLFRAPILQAVLDTLWCSGADPSARGNRVKHFAARVAPLRMARRGGEMDVNLERLLYCFTLDLAAGQRTKAIAAKRQ